MFHISVNDVVAVTRKAAESTLFRVENTFSLQKDFLQKCTRKERLKVKVLRVTYTSNMEEEEGNTGVVEIVKISPVTHVEELGLYWYILAKDVEDV